MVSQVNRDVLCGNISFPAMTKIAIKNSKINYSYIKFRKA